MESSLSVVPDCQLVEELLLTFFSGGVALPFGFFFSISLSLLNTDSRISFSLVKNFLFFFISVKSQFKTHIESIHGEFVIHVTNANIKQLQY